MIAFIDAPRDRYGVEPICDVLPIARRRTTGPNTGLPRPGPCASRSSGSRSPGSTGRTSASTVSARCGASCAREGIGVARCTVEGLMAEQGLQGVRRGKRSRTTVPGAAVPRAADLVERDFSARRPNELWVADLTYVATWSGFVYMTFIFDALSRFIVGWQVSRSLRTDLALGALEMGIWRRLGELEGLVHHSDRGNQYLSIRYTQRLAEAGAVTSIGSRGNSYDNALAESVIGLYKTELIRRRGPWKGIDDVEYATLEWVDWFNHRRLLEPIRHIPPAEFEAVHYRREEPLGTLGLNQASLQ